ncbi:CinA family protein [Roseomonas xinghualingensis]|uniref:CinA family protein n=1 Tax=Roseomonas xinghualingensis TaxID=2986475 RepID=UPI0021F1E860|nr:nicotinamide-nucleotide amidohydrolase family protein [Roseomonas sp. SXEYE001]MCV4206822.1 nicotinamide-nucleotide amidohydrolase family protein [Roseomonas sp. SXEYE001]
MLPPSTIEAAATLLTLLRQRSLTIATAESCTGGLVSAALTAVPGSSDVVLGGLVTYSNAMKMRFLDVPEAVLSDVGAVSEECARQMALGALRETGADLAVSTTGIAGPGGGSAAKPVGLVFIGMAQRDGSTRVQQHIFPGDRDTVRAETVKVALQLAMDGTFPN